VLTLMEERTGGGLREEGTSEERRCCVFVYCNIQTFSMSSVGASCMDGSAFYECAALPVALRGSRLSAIHG
jgi:hypothetical protein